MWPFSSRSVVPVLRFSGPIGMVTPLRPGLTLAAYAGAIEKAFSLSKLPAVAVVINSPGGSPVQSNLLFKRIRQLAEEKEKRVYVFCEDVAASGGYFLAIAGDEIYADPSSIIGSIGVVSRSFGFVDMIQKLGIERRVYTAGPNKNQLDPFLPEDAGRRCAAQVHPARRARRIHRSREGTPSRQAQGAGCGTLFRSLLVGHQSGGIGPHRRHHRSPFQDAADFRRQGQTEGRTSRPARPVGTPPAVFGVDRI